MNLLVAGQPQVLVQGGWQQKLGVNACDTGNGMTSAEISAFSDSVDLLALRAYRLTVGRSTRAIVRSLQPADIKRKVEPALMQRVWDEGALTAAARSIGEYWASRDVAGLLLMPATRHPLIHLNEAALVRRKLT